MKRTFTLAASTIPGEFIIPRTLPEIARLLPDIELKLDVTDSLKVFEKIKRGDVELGVIGNRYDAADVEYTTIIKSDRLVIIAAKGSALTGRKEVSFEDLRKAPLVCREPGSGTREAYEKAFGSAGLKISDLNVIAEISDTEGVIQAVEAGAGISIVSELAAKEAIELGKIVVLDAPHLAVTRDFSMITRKGQSLSPDCQKVFAVLKLVFRK